MGCDSEVRMSGGGAMRIRRMAIPIGPSAAFIRRMIVGIDDRLSRRADVRSFTDDPECLLRIAPTVARRPVRLSDGTDILVGDLVLDIHCWNERVPPIPRGGADLPWAVGAAGRLRRSLSLLAAVIETTPALQPTRAIRARVNFVGLGGSNESVSRIIARLGFEDVDEGARSLSARVHDALENVLISALVWTHNPEALRRDKLIRERRPVWCSRRRLQDLHGA